MGTMKLGRVAGLDLSATTPALWGSAALWVLLAAVGIGGIGWPAGQAVGLALLGVALHWIFEFLHQLGHAIAASRTGHPMTGVRFGVLGLFSASVYPENEPALPGRIHVTRALGGPLMSLLLAVLAGILALAVRGSSDAAFWVLLFVSLENALVFGIGALIPLGFNDGSTLVQWWGKR